MLQHLSGLRTQNSCRCITSKLYTSSSSINLRSHDSSDYSKTVFLPKSTFLPKHNPEQELKIQENPAFAGTYLDQEPARKPYVIHDGPPFANGQIHIGHAINKILKDIAARHAMITGHRVEFITGWDCHGLPIELQVLKLLEQLQKQDGSQSPGGSPTICPENFRAKARAYAKSQIDLQMASFKRIGLLTDWNKRYTTDDPSYVANQLRAFSQLHEQKLIFKDLMPVQWSLTNKTTLADADIEYRNEHVSQSAYVMYKIIDPPFLPDLPGQPFYAITWTTTPWTLLDNQAIAFNKQETYCILRAWNHNPIETRNFLLAVDSLNRVQNLLTRLGFEHEMKTYLPGSSLVGLKYEPLLTSFKSNDEQAINPEPLPLLDASFVDASKGTGLVHIAPNYGQDDFNLFKSTGLKLCKQSVNQEGRFARGIQLLEGKHIFTDGNQQVLNLLDKHQALLMTENTMHSYPYETRTNQPIIIRASQQMFLSTQMIVARCLKALQSASFFPEHRRTHFINTLSSSPDWCISRQRVWGTPIPVLYHKDDENQEKIITHPKLVDHFCKLLYKKRFMDYWWTVNNEELVPQSLLDECKLSYKSEDLVRGSDIFDVWSDSGLSWHTTANSLNDNKSQADLYLEGVDQIRGWFSASTMLSIALRGCLPTKRFFLHGFALDETGRKMSKSKGNVVDPIQLFQKYGVDPIRLWAAKHAGSNNDILVNSRTFRSSIGETISKVRLTFKYLIGILNDQHFSNEKVDISKLELFDQYYLDKLYRFTSTIDGHYKNYRYDLVVKTISDFLSNDLSPIYITSSKDILYCDDADSKRRKSCIHVLRATYDILLRCLYPIIPHIVHEAKQHLESSVPLNSWEDLGFEASWKNSVLHCQFEKLIGMRSILMQLMGSEFESMRDHDLILFTSDKKLFKELCKITNTDTNLMTELFKTSTFILSHDERLKEPENCNETQVEQKAEEGSGESVCETSKVKVNLLRKWMLKGSEGLRVGGLISIDGGAAIRIEMNYKRTNNVKCSRCRRFSVVNIQEEHANVCDRCKDALHKLEYC